MDGYTWLILLTIIITLVPIFIVRKRKEYKYSFLDIFGIILNAVLLFVVYPPMTAMGAYLSVDRFATEPFLIFVEGVAITMGLLVPSVAILGIGTSIILRRKEKRWLSFAVQFTGVVWFVLTMVVAKLSGSY